MTATEHDATHIIDKGCCAVMKTCITMVDSAFTLNATAELEALASAVAALHERASEAHSRIIERGTD